MMSPMSRHKPKTESILLRILAIKEPPVARCRLLSRGLEPYHRLGAIGLEAAGDKGCLACGNCIDSCPVLRREPDRFSKTDQRTSMALEAIVGEDCEQCCSCVLSCPQVDTNIKDYIVDEFVVEVIPQSRRLQALLDHYLVVPIALLIGVILGLFISR
jgi:heterodisulfide reductase subunit C